MTRVHHTRLAGFLARLNLQPGEGARLGLMMLYAAAAFGGVLTTGFVVSSALFLSRLPASAIPYLFILPAMVIIPSLLVYHRVAARYRFDQVAVGSTILLLALVLVFRTLLATPYGASFAVLIALALFIELASVLVVMQFWVFAGQLFNPREARRRFGLMVLGGTLANVVAGLSLAVVVRIMGPENLLFIVTAALMTCIFCASRLGHLQQGNAKGAGIVAVDTAQGGSLSQDIRAIRRSPLLLSIAGFAMLVALLVNVGIYQFFLALQLSYAGREEAMVVFLGRFEFFAGLAALFVQGYLASKVLRRYGIFVALLFFPLGVAVAALLGLMTGGALLAMALIRAADPVFSRTINNAALNILYLPVPAKLRGQAKSLFEALYALSYGLAGVIFLVMQRVPQWTYVHWGIPLIGLAALWLVLLLNVRRHYLHALAENVKKRQLDLSAVTMDVTDEATARILAQALTHPDELQVLHALKLIENAPKGDWGRFVSPLLEHPSPQVRLQALDCLTSLQPQPADAWRIAKLLEAPEEEVRAAALQAYGARAGEVELAELKRFLADPSPRVRGAAIAALMAHGGSEDAHAAAKALDAMLASRDPATRQEGIRALGLVGNRRHGAMLLPLLDDPTLEVQRSAVHASGRLRSPELLPYLIGKLEHPVLASAASEAVAAYGMKALPVLAEILQDLNGSRQGRIWAVKTLGRLGGHEAAETLLAQLRDPAGAVRLAICQSLAQLNTTPLISLEVKEALLDELHAAYELRVLGLELRSTALLEEALRARFDEALERIFLLLALRYPDGDLKRAHAALKSDDAGMRAMAVELLDNVLERDLKALILPLLEAPAEHVLALAQSRFTIASKPLEARVQELAVSSDSWVRACAIYELGALGRLDLIGPVLAALLSDEPLLRETALHSCRCLLEPGELIQLLKDHAANDPSPRVSVYARMMLESP
jgi:ATP:ADP antiporter, AAA family